jgi:hypothetical protein
MELLFPGRDRRQLKNKFKREERLHADLVQKYLDSKQPLEVDIQFSEAGGVEVGAGVGAEAALVPDVEEGGSVSGSTPAPAPVAPDAPEASLEGQAGAVDPGAT